MLRLAHDLLVATAYSQLVLSDLSFQEPSIDDAQIEAGDYDDLLGPQAIDDAHASGRRVGVHGATLIVVLTPEQWNPELPLRIELHDGVPAADDDRWQHVVEADLDLPGGSLSISSPTVEEGGVDVRLGRGAYRVRIAGGGFTRRGLHEAAGSEAWRLQLWLRVSDAAPEVLRFWPGWND